MTTIVASTGHGGAGVRFASDTQTTWGSRAEMVRGKVFVNGNLVFGGAGSYRSGDILRHADIPACPTGLKGIALDKWLVRDLVPRMQEEFAEARSLEANDGEARYGGMFILAASGSLFTISAGFAIVRANGFAAIGSGSPYALGALRAGASLRDAVKIASEFDVYTGSKVVEYDVDRMLA